MHGMKRLTEPPATISDSRRTALSDINIEGWPFITYAVHDFFILTHGKHRYAAVLCSEADAALLSIPGMEPIVCFIPIPGKGHYGQDTVRPSILFWRDQFWAPLYSMSPEREDIAKAVYGDDILKTHTFDVLYPVNVQSVPDVDLLKINDPQAVQAKDEQESVWRIRL